MADLKSHLIYQEGGWEPYITNNDGSRTNERDGNF